ncbi:hypothetical protein HC358_02815 [Wolbachia pipientis]|uniref:Uncharacterized protein n=1 Tax=Wolbachia pipientis TaxID=955 RepID=A0A7G5C9Y4_WOLPI|nr:hypothetical protein [Wolbachia pipientis]QMV46018.1 hypothetical protein HC358_02815 [Wolbachia pipientis]
MVYSNDDIRELYRKIATIVKYDDKGIASLKDLQKEPKWKEVNFQDKCEGDNSLGDLLLKHATENNNTRVKDFLLQSGCKPLQQEQITAAINKEEEGQNTPDIGENKANGFVDAQFSVPNEKEAKYKESKENFYTSLTKDVVGVVITGLFIAAAVMVPFVAGAAICGIIAALGAVCTELHIKKFTLPSYREMEKNKVEHVSSKTAQIL